MEAKIENRLDMMRNVMSDCKDNSTIIGSIPALHDAFAKFVGKMSFIETIVIALQTEAKSFTAAKNNAKEDLVNKTDIVASGLRSLAHALGDEPLMIEVRFSPKRMLKQRYDVLIGKCNSILAIANAHNTELVNHGVDSNVITALSGAISAYVLKSQEPRKASDMRKEYNAELAAALKELTDLLKNEMDPMVHILPDLNTAFKGVYINARAIYDRHGKRRRPAPVIGIGLIEGTITAAFDGSPVEGALVHNVELDLMVESDEDGDYYFENVPAGVYTIKVLADTYLETAKSSVKVVDEAEVAVDFKLEAVPAL
jgi:hypothetical protein